MSKITMILFVVVLLVACCTGKNLGAETKCGANQVLDRCGPICPSRCGQGPGCWTRVCRDPPRCFCAPGFIAKGEDCVRPSEC